MLDARPKMFAEDGRFMPPMMEPRPNVRELAIVLTKLLRVSMGDGDGVGGGDGDGDGDGDGIGDDDNGDGENGDGDGDGDVEVDRMGLMTVGHIMFSVYFRDDLPAETLGFANKIELERLPRDRLRGGGVGVGMRDIRPDTRCGLKGW